MNRTRSLYLDSCETSAAKVALAWREGGGEHACRNSRRSRGAWHQLDASTSQTQSATSLGGMFQHGCEGFACAGAIGLKIENSDAETSQPLYLWSVATRLRLVMNFSVTRQSVQGFAALWRRGAAEAWIEAKPGKWSERLAGDLGRWP